MSTHRMLVYCGSNQEGIEAWSFDPATGAVSEPFRATQEPLKSFFLAPHPALPVLYSLDLPRGLVSAFAIEANGTLRLFSEVSSEGKAPCHLEADPAGRFLLVANYNGDPAIFPLDAEGRLSPAAATLHLEGSGPEPRRQAGSHPHGINLAPEGGFAYVTDLGIDRIAAVTIDPATLRLCEDSSRSTRLHPGAGPRHFAISPDKAFAVVVNELDNTVTAFRREADGSLTTLNTRSTLPPGFTAETWTAEIAYHPAAPVCYATNRGHNTLAAFPFNPETGELAEPRWVASGGGKPQHFALDPAGRHLFVANAETGNVTLLRVDEEGLPTEGAIASIPVAMAMCVLVVPHPAQR